MEKVNLRVKARKATPRMKKFNILGSANVEFLNKDKSKVLVSIENISVRKSKKKGQRPWVAMPQVEYQDKDGETKYKTIVKIAPDEDMNEEGGFKEYFDNMILGALKKAIQAGDDDEEEKPRQKPKPKSNEWGDDDDEEEKPRKKEKPRDDDEWEDADSNDDDDDEIW